MKAKEYIKSNKEQMISDLRTLVKIPSIFDEATAGPGKPFGESVNKALRQVLEIADKMGMQVKNYDGYAGEATIGRGKKMAGILGHIDVVAAGEGWDKDPFEMEITDGKMYGRGTIDDKGPLVACLYAMKYMKENGLLPEDTSIRLIIGADEEENWECIDHYHSAAERLPDCSIVPDGNFPLIYCEKGLLDADFSYAVPEEKEGDIAVQELYGGTAKNVVPSKAYCRLRCNSAEQEKKLINALSGFDGVEVMTKDGVAEITVSGKGTHAMSPEKGLNAVSRMMDILERAGKETAIQPVYETYNKYIGMTYNGEKFGCSFEDEASGKLTFNVGTIELRNGHVQFGASVRYPATIAQKDVQGVIEETCAAAGMEMTVQSLLPALYVDKDSPFIEALMKSYRDVTGDADSAPISIGGATYARTIPNAVAFGPLFPYEEELAHEPNEFLTVESFEKMTLIYIEALKNMTKWISEV